jgi:hypothetical protein
MVTETVAIIAVSGALLGAALNSVRAWYQAPDTEHFSWRKFVAGLTSGSLAALGVINFVTLPEQAAEGLVALFIGNALLGAGASTALAQVHK